MEPLNWIPEDGFVAWQAEKGEQKETPHLQGYLELQNAMSLSAIKKKFHPTAHWEVRRGTQEQALAYATKCEDETYVDGPWCYGEMKQKSGTRNDLIRLREMMKEGASMQEIKDEDFNTYCRAKHALDEEYQIIQTEIAKKRRIDQYEGVIWKPWQADIISIVESEPDKRQIHWFYETEGNVGKSFLCNYLMCKHDAFIIKGGRVQDIQYAYQSQRIVVYDLSRTKAESMDHLFETMEQFKDGSFLSTKYNSVLKVFDSPHVIVFANFSPDESKLSADRWNITKISNKPYDIYSYSPGFNGPLKTLNGWGPGQR